MAKDEVFHHLGRNEVEVLNACVGAKLTMNKDEEVLDVCIAIQNLEEKAAMTTLLGDIKKLMKNMDLSIEQSMDVLEVSEDDREQLLELLN